MPGLGKGTLENVCHKLSVEPEQNSHAVYKNKIETSSSDLTAVRMSEKVSKMLLVMPERLMISSSGLTSPRGSEAMKEVKLSKCELVCSWFVTANYLHHVSQQLDGDGKRGAH